MTAVTHGGLSFLHPSPNSSRATDRVIGLNRRIARTLRRWRQRMREREALLQLSYRDMRDIGATPAEISWEASQPFWREARRR